MNAITPSLFIAAKPGCTIVQQEASEALAKLPVASVSCIVTDPPYGIAYHSNYYKDRNPHAPIAQDWNFEIGPYLRAAERALVDGGALYLFTRWDVLPLWAKEVPSGLSLKNAIIWKKDNWSSGDLTGNFGFQYEIIMFLTKGRHQIRGKRWPNVWEFPRVPSKRLRMPAEKPTGLFARAIEASSNPGDLVVDTFLGSGTCAEAALETERRFVGCDTDPKMVRMSRERIGLPVEPLEPRQMTVPCPVLNVVPPDPHLWGIHPEDLSDWLSPEQS